MPSLQDIQTLAHGAALGARTRAVLALQVSGHSYGEIASELGMSQRTVERQLLRVRLAVGTGEERGARRLRLLDVERACAGARDPISSAGDWQSRQAPRGASSHLDPAPKAGAVALHGSHGESPDDARHARMAHTAGGRFSGVG